MSFTCPDCGMTSHHPEDEKNRYCGACHSFKPARVALLHLLAGGVTACGFTHWPPDHRWVSADEWRATTRRPLPEGLYLCPGCVLAQLDLNRRPQPPFGPQE